MSAFESKWADWQPKGPTQRTDKTDRRAFVSFVSASPRRSEGEFSTSSASILHQPRPALSPVALTTLYPVPASDEWLADQWYSLRQKPDPDDFEERVAIMQYDGALSRDEAEKFARDGTDSSTANALISWESSV